MSWNDLLTNTSNGGNQEEVKYSKLNVGTTRVRILDDEPYSRYTHWIQSANAGKGTGIDCIGITNCPCCKDIKAKKAIGQKSKFSNARSNAINVWNYNTNQLEILDKGTKIFQAIATIASQMGNPKNYDINITRAGDTLGNISYTVLPVYPPAPMSSELVEKTNKLYDIREIRKPLTLEQINGLIDGKSLKDVTSTDVTMTENNENGVPELNLGAIV